MASNDPRIPTASNTATVGDAVRTRPADYSDADLVPGQWKALFTNEDWLVHGIIVYSTYGFLAIAIVAHILVYLWRPWLP